MKIVNAKAERSRLLEEISQYPVGSEEYLNATKAYNQLAESDSRGKRLDVNTVVQIGASAVLLVVSLLWGETHILDSKPYAFVKTFMKK